MNATWSVKYDISFWFYPISKNRHSGSTVRRRAWNRGRRDKYRELYYQVEREIKQKKKVETANNF